MQLVRLDLESAPRAREAISCQQERVPLADQTKRYPTRYVADRFKTYPRMLPQCVALEVPIADKRSGTYETDRNQTPVCNMVEGRCFVNTLPPQGELKGVIQCPKYLSLQSTATR